MCKEFMYENKVFINDCYVTFNIIELNREEGKITVNICCQGHHTIDTFELKRFRRLDLLRVRQTDTRKDLYRRFYGGCITMRIVIITKQNKEVKF